MRFYTGFAQTLSLGWRNKMVGLGEQYQYILRAELIHLNFGVDVINQIRIENPYLCTRVTAQLGELDLSRLAGIFGLMDLAE